MDHGMPPVKSAGKRTDLDEFKDNIKARMLSMKELPEKALPSKQWAIARWHKGDGNNNTNSNYSDKKRQASDN